MAESSDDVEGYGEDDAKQNRGCEREVEGCVRSAMDYVAGEAAEAEWEFTGEVEESAGGDEDGAEDEEGAAEGAGGVHGEEFSAEG